MSRRKMSTNWIARIKLHESNFLIGNNILMLLEVFLLKVTQEVTFRALFPTKKMGFACLECCLDYKDSQTVCKLYSF